MHTDAPLTDAPERGGAAAADAPTGAPVRPTPPADPLSHRLLDAEEERDALKRAHAARLVAALSPDALPSALAARRTQVIADGTAARTKLVEHNIRLAVKFSRRYRGDALEDADLRQEAFAGLVLAVDRYDPALGFRFTTYASWWIRQRCGRAVKTTGRMVRVPEGMEHALAAAKEIDSRYRSPDEAKQTGDALADELGINRRRFVAAQVATVHPRSLDQQLPSRSGHGTATTLGDLIADESPDVADQVSTSLLSGQVRDLVGTLQPHERVVLALRFGLDGSPPATLREVGEHMGWTHERVRLVERDAVARLRHMAAARALEA